MVYFCYVDESGTLQIPGNTSHYVLCGISIMTAGINQGIKKVGTGRADL